jgi:hypothetical protein
MGADGKICQGLVVMLLAILALNTFLFFFLGGFSEENICGVLFG